jgi:hypothetical protein
MTGDTIPIIVPFPNAEGGAGAAEGAGAGAGAPENGAAGAADGAWGGTAIGDAKPIIVFLPSCPPPAEGACASGEVL